MGDQLSDFAKLIKECREKKSDRLIYNASFEHAKELFRALLEEAKIFKLPVKITSGALRLDFYLSLVDDAQKVIDSGAKIELAVLSPESEVNLKNHPFVELLLKNNCIVRQVTAKKKGMHFILVGDKRFRFETDHEQTKAVACFNNPTIGKILDAEFSKIIGLDSMRPVSAT